jgi:drug/metabolite transporter (DMT)-like permease
VRSSPLSGRWTGDRLPFLVLAVGVVAVSSAAVLVRKAEAPALAIAAYRLAFASLPVLVLAWAMGRPASGKLELRVVGLCLLSGAFLAAHFAFWFAGIQRTSVASAVALVALQPLFGWLFSLVFLREGVNRFMVAAILVGAMGTALIAIGDAGEGGDELLGDLYAVIGGMLAALYLTVGRAVRADLSAASYVALVYPAATLLLFAAALVGRVDLTGFPAETWVFLMLLGFVPQLIGHTSINWALGFLTVPYVTVAILGEPVGATLLAMPVLGEYPGPWVVAGLVVIVAGLAAGTWGEWLRQRQASRSEGAGLAETAVAAPAARP